MEEGTYLCWGMLPCYRVYLPKLWNYYWNVNKGGLFFLWITYYFWLHDSQNKVAWFLHDLLNSILIRSVNSKCMVDGIFIAGFCSKCSWALISNVSWYDTNNYEYLISVQYVFKLHTKSCIFYIAKLKKKMSYHLNLFIIKLIFLKEL